MSRPYTTPEIKAVYDNFIGRYELRNKSILICQMYIGARISDILSLTISDVYSHDKLRYDVRITESKTKKLKEVQIVKEFRAKLERWINHRIDVNRATYDSPLFMSERGNQLSYKAYLDALQLATRASGVDFREYEIGAHSPRKWYGNTILDQLVVSGVKFIDALQTVRKLYNHESLATTTCYLGLDAQQTKEANINHAGVSFV